MDKQQPQLGERDKVVLDVIFDPLQPLGIAPAQVSQPESQAPLAQAEEDPELDAEARALLRRAILLAESREFEEALGLFDALLRAAPRSVSALNDQAQTLRLLGRDEEALAKLDRALELSGGRGGTGVRALCQRGALRRRLGRDEEAREDFGRAAEAGSGFARAQLVAMNPYAAMCGAMLRKVGARPL